MTTITRHEYDISARNGEPLTLTRFDSVMPASRGVVLIAAAMATPARYYARLAEWYAGEGYTVYTFDYQGYGASARTHLKEVTADFLTWTDDAAVVLEHVAGESGELPIHWVGHSLGGQALAFVDHTLLTDATLLCSGTGYWGISEGLTKLLAPVLWYTIAPITTGLLGYYPGRKLRILGDLPSPVMKQWGGWCKKADYMFAERPELAARYAAVELPITSISFTDDETMSDAATAQLEGWYSSADLTRRRLSPEELGVPEVKHMGIIRQRYEGIWPIVFGR